MALRGGRSPSELRHTHQRPRRLAAAVSRDRRLLPARRRALLAHPRQAYGRVRRVVRPPRTMVLCRMATGRTGILRPRLRGERPAPDRQNEL